MTVSKREGINGSPPETEAPLKRKPLLKQEDSGPQNGSSFLLQQPFLGVDVEVCPRMTLKARPTLKSAVLASITQGQRQGQTVDRTDHNDFLPLPSLGSCRCLLSSAYSSTTHKSRSGANLTSALRRSTHSAHPLCGTRGCPHCPWCLGARAQSLCSRLLSFLGVFVDLLVCRRILKA